MLLGMGVGAGLSASVGRRLRKKFSKKFSKLQAGLAKLHPTIPSLKDALQEGKQAMYDKENELKQKYAIQESGYRRNR